MTKQWHEFRRHLAWTAISLWMLLGATPIAALTVIAMSGRRFVAPSIEIVIRFVVPAALFTGGAFFAVRILRTGDPDRSRIQAWRLVVTFVAGLLAFLASAYMYGR